MSANNGNDQATNAYYYANYQYQTPGYTMTPQNWNWTSQQQQQYHRNVPPPPIANTYAAYNSTQYYQGYTEQQSQQYNSPQATNTQPNFTIPPPPPPGPSPSPGDSKTHSYHSPSSSRPWNNHQNGRISNMKRNMHDDVDRRRKRKKPLSQKNLPTKSKWTKEEAERALQFERAFNNLSKNSLIIKFPDFPISREMVANYHPEISNIYFPTPVAPRNCFISLKDDVDAEEVIKSLEKIVPEGASDTLKVEVKPNRNDTKETKPEDIDPLTLYVGNLASDVQKDDIVTMFPKNRRIDIGFAKKMKYTRYAFVVFHECTDALEAFKHAFNADLYGKSLIVRFRRVHGTVGMPGEANLQNPANKINDSADASSQNHKKEITLNSSSDDSSPIKPIRLGNTEFVKTSDSPLYKEINSPAPIENPPVPIENPPIPTEIPPPPPGSPPPSPVIPPPPDEVEWSNDEEQINKVDESKSFENEDTKVDLNIVKQEPVSSTSVGPIDFDKLFAIAARPIVVKTEVTTEADTEEDIPAVPPKQPIISPPSQPIISPPSPPPPIFDEKSDLAVKIKEEPMNDDLLNDDFSFEEELRKIQLHNQKTQELRLKSKAN